LVGFVNGLLLVVIELKKPGVPSRAAFDENLRRYKAEIPLFFGSKRSSAPRTPRISVCGAVQRRACGSTL